MTFDLRPPICTRLIFVSKWKRVPKFKKLPQGVLKISRWQKWVRPVCICIQIGGWTSWKYYASGRGYRPLRCVTKHPYTVCRRGIKAAQNERKPLVAIVVSVLPTDKCISTAAHICRSPFLLQLSPLIHCPLSISMTNKMPLNSMTHYSEGSF